MNKYFRLQLKKMLKFLPSVLVITVLLIITTSIIAGITITRFQSKNTKKFTIAITGDTDSEYIQLGFSALKFLDETRFSVDILQMDENEAKSALSRGKISAYAVLPEDFIENALVGKVKPVTYVTTSGASHIGTLFKNEITTLISDFVIYSEKGVYAVADSLESIGLGDKAEFYMNKLNLEYIDLILNRSNVFSLKQLDTGSQDRLITGIVCGVSVLLIMLMGLPFAPAIIKKDHSLTKLFCSRGYSKTGVLFCEFASHLISMTALSSVILLLGALGALLLDISFLTPVIFLKSAYLILPVIIMISAFNIFIFELCSDTVSGVLLHFFTTVALCFVSGCIFPPASLPQIFEKASHFLPTGIAREYVASFVFGNADIFSALSLLVASAVLFILTALIRCRKIGGESI